MKKLLIIALSFGLAFSASAQRGHFSGGGYRGGYVHYSAPVRVYGGLGYYNPWYGYGMGYGFGLGYGFGFGYGLGWSPYWGYPYAPYYQDRYMPSRLALQVEDIKNDYKERIASTKDNKSLTGKERRTAVRQLKHDRDAAIIEAKRNYYYNSRNSNGNNYNNGYRNNGYNGNGNNNGSNEKSTNPDGTVNEYKQ
ncbi:MAG: hypothetical protein P4L51_00490 [Puia sp.]|nr:hypothetical protein [Puia sp.]